jgi:chaperonin GroES
MEEERTSPGGIVLPDAATEKPIQGEVLAVGSGKITDKGDVRPLDVKVGDKVLFGKYSGTEVKIAGEEVLVMREEDIMGVIEG